MAAKLILGFRKFDSASAALKHLHWLPIRFRIHFKIAVTVFKCLHGCAPNYLSDLVRQRKHVRQLRSSTQGTNAIVLEVPFHRRQTFLDRSFCYSGPHVWNGLPSEIRSCTKFNMFKKSLKTFYFKCAFDCY